MEHAFPVFHTDMWNPGRCFMLLFFRQVDMHTVVAIFCCLFSESFHLPASSVTDSVEATFRPQIGQ